MQNDRVRGTSHLSQELPHNNPNLTRLEGNGGGERDVGLHASRNPKVGLSFLPITLLEKGLFPADHMPEIVFVSLLRSADASNR